MEDHPSHGPCRPSRTHTHGQGPWTSHLRPPLSTHPRTPARLGREHSRGDHPPMTNVPDKLKHLESLTPDEIEKRCLAYEKMNRSELTDEQLEEVVALMT